MVRSMMNLTTLPLSFWDYALETATRILNKVPTKKVDKTPYELWVSELVCCNNNDDGIMIDLRVVLLVSLVVNGIRHLRMFSIVEKVVREEATVGKNVSNKRKCGSDHGRDSDQQQSKRIEVVRAHATGAGNKKATSAPITIKRAQIANQKPAVACFGCGAQGHFKRSRKFGDSQLTGPETVNETTGTKKSYADVRRKLLEFQVGVKGMM
ncbi:hypothetical protein Tco_1393179 [Tanacetum coccineum]